MSYATVVEILQSLSSVKGIKVEINASFWGEEYAATAEKPKFTGVIDRWDKVNTKDALFILWEGHTRNQKAPLDKMDTDAQGNSLELKLLPGNDGRVPEKQAAAPAPAPEPEPQPADPDSGGKVIVSGGQRWTLRTANYVNSDRRSESRWKPLLNAGGKDTDNIVKLFYLLVPTKWIARIMKYTNPLLDEHDPIHLKISEGEALRFFGYMLSLSIHTGIPLERMWSKTPLPGSTGHAPMMGRFGMTQNRFNKLRSIIRFGPTDDAAFEQNEWCHVEGLVDEFNEHMEATVIPGWLLAPDESMSAWRGKQGKKDPKKIPKLQFVKRKPEPLGCELKDVACALSRMIVRMEIMKGKADEVKPKFWSKEVGATAATTMRLTEPWFGSRRVVAGDSWFASVNTAQLLEENGLYFVGDVKTGTSRFVPNADYSEATPAENGAWATFTTDLKLRTDKIIPIYCVTHRRGESIHAFVSSCGTTLPGNAVMAYFEDDEERVQTEVSDFELSRKCPRILNDFTLAQPSIDSHNRYRQHILAMEKRLVTNNWSFRFFTTLLGMVVVNAFFAHRYFNNELAEFKVEVDKLALALMTNPKAEKQAQAAATTPPKASRTAPGSPESPAADGAPHTLVPLRSILGDNWKKGKQMRCMVCNHDTVWVCGCCSSGADALVPICPEYTIPRKGPNKGNKVMHSCVHKHRSAPLFFPKGRCRGGGNCKRQRSPDAADLELSDADGSDGDC